MKAIVTVMLFGLGLGTCFLAGCSGSSHAPAEWEYAELTFVETWTFAEGDMTWLNWEGPEGDPIYREGSFKKFAKKLNIEIDHENTTELLNGLAEHGWELNSHSTLFTQADQNFVYKIWMLQRKK